MKNIILYSAIFIFFVLFCYEKCKNNSNEVIHKNDTPITIIDTFTIMKDTFIYKSKISRDTFFVADTNKIKINFKDLNLDCQKQLNDLLESYYETNIYKDTIYLFSDKDFLILMDTINSNSLYGRGEILHSSIPEIVKTKTVTIPQDLKRQLFFGIGIGGDNNSYLRRFNVGFLYKNKKDWILNVSGTIDISGNKGVELQSFWKIHL